jgi:hypothetical protein
MTIPPMIVGAITTVIGPTFGGTNVKPSGEGASGPSPVGVVVAVARETSTPIATRLLAATTAAVRRHHENEDGAPRLARR